MAKKPRRVEDLTTLDDFLDEEGIREEVTARARQRVKNIQAARMTVPGGKIKGR